MIFIASHCKVHIVRQNDAVSSSFLTGLGDGLILTEDDARLIDSRFVD